jgi:hypothetical protein
MTVRLTASRSVGYVCRGRDLIEILFDIAHLWGLEGA